MSRGLCVPWRTDAATPRMCCDASVVTTDSPCLPDIVEMNWIRRVLFGMNNKIFGPYLAAIDKILASAMRKSPRVLGARDHDRSTMCWETPRSLHSIAVELDTNFRRGKGCLPEEPA
jgi:hypothetical protein